MNSFERKPVARHIKRLDTLRALAVTVVVLFHLQPELLPWGYIGVDMFFSLSGFLMTWLFLLARADGKPFPARKFIARRFWRIFPPLSVTVLATLLVAALILSPTHLEEAATSGLAALLSVSNWFFFSQSGYFDTNTIFKPLLHTWSLGVEEQFYAVFAVALLTVRYVPLWVFLSVVAMVSTVLWSWVVLANFDTLLPTLHQEPFSALFYLPQYRAFQFALGGLAAYWAFRSNGHLPPRWLFPVAIGILFIGCWIATDEAAAHVSALIVTFGMILVMRDAPIFDRIADLVIVRYLARISYQLYLVHWPVVVFWSYLTGTSLGWVGTFFCGILSIILGDLLYRMTNPLRMR